MGSVAIAQAGEASGSLLPASFPRQAHKGCADCAVARLRTRLHNVWRDVAQSVVGPRAAAQEQQEPGALQVRKLRQVVQECLVLPTLDAIPQCSWTREATRSRPSLARLELVMTYRSSRYASSSSPACNSAAARSRPSCWPSEKSAGVRAEKSQRDDQLIAFLRARSWEHKSAFAGHSQTFPRERRSISQNFVRASPKKGRTGLAPVREQRIPPLSAPSPAATPTVAEGEDGFSRSSSTPNCLWPGGIQCRSCRQRGLAPTESINARRVRLPAVRENGPYPRVPFTDDPGVGACRGLWG